jgi:hypothetical protein
MKVLIVGGADDIGKYLTKELILYRAYAVPGSEGKLIYTTKNGKTNKVFPALEWMAAMCSHIPIP